MVKRGSILLAVGLLFLLTSFASASIVSSNYTLYQKSYLDGDLLNGVLKIKLQNESSNSLFTGSGTNIKLIDAINAAGYIPNRDYNCSVYGCNSIYEKSSIVQGLSLGNGEIKPVGVALSLAPELTLSSVNSVKFVAMADSDESCTLPLELGAVDSSGLYISGAVAGSTTCGETKKIGCFSSSATVTDFPLNNVYETCERISLLAAPGYRVGASLKNSTNGYAGDVFMDMFDAGSLAELGHCKLPVFNYSQQDLECDITVGSATAKDFLVCIRAPISSEYSVSAETNAPSCGFVKTATGNGFTNSTRDFNIFARELKFAAAPIVLDKSSFKSSNFSSLESYVSDYISSHYNNKCSPDCIVPFFVKSHAVQNVLILSSEVNYTDNDGVKYRSNSSYAISTPDVRISSKELEFNFSSLNISAFRSSGRAILYLNNQTLMNENISIQSGAFYLSPMTALMGITTTFGIVGSGRTISSVIWNFGEGNTVTSNGSTAKYRFLSQGNKTVEVELRFNDGGSIKKRYFVSVAGARDSARGLLEAYRFYLNNVTLQMAGYSQDIREAIEAKTNISLISQTLTNVELQLNSSLNESNYTDLASELISLRVPYLVSVEQSGKLPLDVGYSNIDETIVEKLEEKAPSGGAELRGRIINWIDTNYVPTVSFEKVSAHYADGLGDSVLLTKFDIDLKKKEGADVGSGINLIINYPSEELRIIGDASVKKIDSASVINVDDRSSVSFIILGDLPAEQLGMYLSPATDSFGTLGTICKLGDSSCTPSFPWGWVILLISLVFIATVVGYIFLQEWYKKNYEKHLFKSPDDLYNILTFVNNSRSAGQKDEDARKKLLKAGWTGEQLSYAFKKIDGKRTGMFEIPLFGLLDRKKIKEEIERRQGVQPDARFIKRPYL